MTLKKTLRSSKVRSEPSIQSHASIVGSNGQQLERHVLNDILRAKCVVRYKDHTDWVEIKLFCPMKMIINVMSEIHLYDKCRYFEVLNPRSWNFTVRWKCVRYLSIYRSIYLSSARDNYGQMLIARFKQVTVKARPDIIQRKCIRRNGDAIYIYIQETSSWKLNDMSIVYQRQLNEASSSLCAYIYI